MPRGHNPRPALMIDIFQSTSFAKLSHFALI